MKVWALILFVVVVVASGCGHQKVDGNVSPTQFETSFVQPGGRTDFTVTVDLLKAPPSTEPLDIAFVFDATTSMTNVFDVVRSRAIEILASIGELSTNTAYATARFTDYGGGGPWYLHQDFTRDANGTRATLERLGVSYDFNQDVQEAYSRALFEAANLSWRPEARRYLILFGDAPVRDPHFYAENLGIDPGRDGVENTGDDLRFVDVVESVRKNGITVLAIYDDKTASYFSSGSTQVAKSFEYMAAETGGVAKLVSDARDIPAAIERGLRDSLRLEPALSAAPEWQEWVDISKPRRINATTFDFNVTVHAPASSGDGVFRFPLSASHAREVGGARIGTVAVTIRVGLANLDWRKILLPLYFLLLALLLLVRFFWQRHLGRSIPYHGHRPVLRFLGRMAAFALTCGAAYGIWMLAPGKLPPFNP